MVSVAATVLNNHVTILQGGTGSGKSTRSMIELTNLGLKGWCSQPRRVNAESLASFCQAYSNREVGYVHGEGGNVTKNTIGIFCTHGVLLSKIVQKDFNPDWIAIDECHEETREVSAILALARARLKAGWKTRVLIISATMNVEVVKNHFSEFSVEIIHMGGVKYPIEDKHYLQSDETLINKELLERLNAGRSGIIFFEGKEICNKFAEDFPKSNRFDIIVCTSQTENLSKVVHGKGKPRLLVATNVLGAGITPGENISFIATNGKKKEYREEGNVEALVTCDCSQAELLQLRGRTGRTCNGEFLLFSETSMEMRPVFPAAEINRTMPHKIVLTLAGVGCKVTQLRWINPPDLLKCQQSEIELKNLGVLGTDGKPTDIGNRLLAMPISPKLGVALLESEKTGSTYLAATIIAIMEVGQVLVFNDSTNNIIANYHSEEISELVAQAQVITNQKTPRNVFMQKNLREVFILRDKLLKYVKFSTGYNTSFLKYLYNHTGTVTTDSYGNKVVRTTEGLLVHVDKYCTIPLSVNDAVYCEIRSITTKKGGQMRLAINMTKKL